VVFYRIIPTVPNPNLNLTLTVTLIQNVTENEYNIDNI